MAGFYKGVEVLAISTGMGGVSTSIAVEELRNIGIEYMIRVGSCGSLQSGINIGDLIIASGAVRDDGTSKAYVPVSYPAVPDFGLAGACIRAARSRRFPCHLGVVRSHESFYIDDIDDINDFWTKKGVLGSDMETAALFTVGMLRGVRCASILNTVVTPEGTILEGVGSYASGEDAAAQGEKREIITALDAFVMAENEEI